MSYLTSTEHQGVIEDPQSVRKLYHANRKRFVADLGGEFAGETEEHLMFGFCSLVAFDLKPYGRADSLSLRDLLRSPALNCGNYFVLSWHLFELLCENRETNLFAVGWDNGPIGNHAQLHASYPVGRTAIVGRNGGHWMVDPTVGIMVCGYDFDSIASGQEVNPASICSFHKACGRSGSRTQELHDRTVSALTRGLYRPSQLLYYYDDLDRYKNPVESFADWMTPQGCVVAKYRDSTKLSEKRPVR